MYRERERDTNDVVAVSTNIRDTVRYVWVTVPGSMAVSASLRVSSAKTRAEQNSKHPKIATQMKLYYCMCIYIYIYIYIYYVYIYIYIYPCAASDGPPAGAESSPQPPARSAIPPWGALKIQNNNNNNNNNNNKNNTLHNYTA